MRDEEVIVEIDYTNYRGERKFRRVQPIEIEFKSNEFHPEEQWLLYALDLEKNAERAFAMKDIHSWRPVEAGEVSVREQAVRWYRSGDTGVSSETIFEVMSGIPVQRHGIPWDPSDFGRCYRLLHAFPEWEKRLPEVSARFAEWKPFVDNWAKMKDLYERDLPTDRSADLYNLMITLRGNSQHSRKVNP